MKYPYIGKSIYSDNLVLFNSKGCGALIDPTNSEYKGFVDWLNESTVIDCTKEALQNTYGEVQSLEHAEFIVELGKNANAEISTEYSKGSFFNFYTGLNGELHLNFFDKNLAKDSGEKQIIIPLPPKESVIEWKEGAVCFAGGEPHYPSRSGFVVDSRGFETSFLDIMDYSDFQLNTIKQGDYVSASSISTKVGFNKVVKVFGLLGYKFEHNSDAVFDSIRSEQCIYAADFGLMFYGSKNGKGRELSVNQVEFIGELKRLEMKCGDEALSSDEETELKSRSMASELNSQPNNDEWPKVGDEVTHPACGLCKVMSLADSNGVVAVLNESGFNVLVFNSDLSKPKTPEDLLIEELQTKLVKNNAVDNWMLAANIISGDIEGLTYTSKDGK